MPSLYTFTLAAMPLLSLFAVTAMHGTSLRNGLYEKLVSDFNPYHETIRGSELLRSPGSFVTIMIGFFTTILDRNNISLHVLGIHFFAIWMSAWVLILLESFRTGPRDISKTAVGLFALAMELVGVAVAVPWWCLVNLYSSYNITETSTVQGMMVPLQDLDILPWSLLLGTGLTALFMQICGYKKEVSINSQQFWIIVRLFHPLLTLSCHRLMRCFSDHASTRKTQEKRRLQAKKLKTIHAIVFWTCAIPHAVVLFAVLTVNWVPRLLGPSIRQSLAPTAIWPAVSPLKNWIAPVESSQDGISIFLFWNELITSISILLWAVVVNGRVLGRASSRMSAGIVAKSLAYCILVGPSAVAVTLIQESDVHILARDIIIVEDGKDR